MGISNNLLCLYYYVQLLLNYYEIWFIYLVSLSIVLTIK